MMSQTVTCREPPSLPQKQHKGIEEDSVFVDLDVGSSVVKGTSVNRVMNIPHKQTCSR